MVDFTQVSASQDVRAWVKFLKTADIPVLKQTAREIARLKDDEDNITDCHREAETAKAHRG